MNDRSVGREARQIELKVLWREAGASDRRARHRLARLGAFSARLSTPLHHRVAFSELVAGFGALVADVHALLADVCGVVRAAGHETCGHTANFCAVAHDYLMLGGSVCAAHMQAVRAALGTDRSAVATILNAGQDVF